MSGTEVRISRVEGIQCLLGETSVTKNSPATPVVHGTFHLRVGGGQSIRILCRRSARRTPRIRSRLRIRPWSLAGGGAIGSLSGYSPASALFPEKKAWALNMPLRIMSCNKDGAPYRCAGVSIRTAGLFSLPGLAAPCWLVAAGSAFRLEDLPCETRFL